MKTLNIELKPLKLSKAWICYWNFKYTSAEQFTDVDNFGIGISRWALLAAAKAWYAAMKEYRQHRAKPGQREAKGWH